MLNLNPYKNKFECNKTSTKNFNFLKPIKKVGANYEKSNVFFVKNPSYLQQVKITKVGGPTKNKRGLTLNYIIFFEFLNFLKINKFIFLFQKNVMSYSTFLKIIHFFQKITHGDPKGRGNLTITSMIFFKSNLYKNPQIFLNFLNFFVEINQFKKQRSLNVSIKRCFKHSSEEFLLFWQITGIQLKMKGKYTQRPGDRRKVYYYRTGFFSVNSAHKKYCIHHQQIVDKSGATGCTFILACR